MLTEKERKQGEKHPGDLVPESAGGTGERVPDRAHQALAAVFGAAGFVAECLALRAEAAWRSVGVGGGGAAGRIRCPASRTPMPSARPSFSGRMGQV
jgi:hypothetical protein